MSLLRADAPESQGGKTTGITVRIIQGPDQRRDCLLRGRSDFHERGRSIDTHKWEWILQEACETGYGFRGGGTDRSGGIGCVTPYPLRLIAECTCKRRYDLRRNGSNLSQGIHS